MRAAVYCRISTDPRGEALGVTRQREDCIALADAAGWTVAEIYTDNDVSATSGMPRPEYNRMLADIEAGKIGAIVAWHPDRLYRRLRDLEGLIDVIERHGAKIRTVRAGDVDLATPTGQMMAQILGAVSQAEGKVKSDRWKRSWRQRRELGQVTPAGWRTFGYNMDGTPMPAEAARVKRIAEDVLAGKAVRAICAELNAEGFITTRGGLWTNSTLRGLLRNPRLAGYSAHKGEIVGDGDWEPIVDRETWRTVVAMLDARSTPHNPRRWLLTGLIRCGLCEHKLSAHGFADYKTYKCLKNEGGCGGVDGKAERVEEVVELYVQRKLADPRVRRRLTEIRSGGQSHLLTEIDTLGERLREIDAQMAEPGRSVAALVRASDAIRTRIESLQAQITTTVPTPIPDSPDEWPKDLGSRRRLVELVVGAVHLDPPPRKGRFYPERVRIDPA